MLNSLQVQIYFATWQTRNGSIMTPVLMTTANEVGILVSKGSQASGFMFLYNALLVHNSSADFNIRLRSKVVSHLSASNKGIAVTPESLLF